MPTTKKAAAPAAAAAKKQPGKATPAPARRKRASRAKSPAEVIAAANAAAPAPELEEAIATALKRARLPFSTDLSAEQMARAADAPKGLAGKALATLILEGKGVEEQIAEGRASGKGGRQRRATQPRNGPREGGGKAAVIQVLSEAEGPMKVAAIAAEVLERKLAPGLQGRTPAATLSAMIQTEAKKAGGLFVKVDRGTFDLRELNPRGAKARPKARS